MGFNVGTLHSGISHALAAVAAVLSTMRQSPNVWRTAAAGPSAVGWKGVVWSTQQPWVSNCSPPSRDCSAVLIHSWLQHLIAWVACSASVPVSDRTLDVLIDYLQDLDLPTDDSRENGWSIGALALTMQKSWRMRSPCAHVFEKKNETSNVLMKT